VSEPVTRPKLIDPFLDKIEEWVEWSGGRVRADKTHERLAAVGFTGNERTTRRAVAAAKADGGPGAAGLTGRGSPEPALWLQWDWGKGPQVPGARTGRCGIRLCSARGWRGPGFRVVLPVWDRTLSALIACQASTLRQVGGLPAYALTDYVPHIIGHHDTEDTP
jgi:hypothetical protein